jgi:Bifunctional DNA primase/polymerase, N-terminal
MTALLDAALDAAERGWPVFPLRPGQKRPRAELTGWERRATTDRRRIERWWRRHPADNIAIATGPAGLVVVDLDLAHPDEPRPPALPEAHGGVDVFAALLARHDRAEATWAVATASGGRHLYYVAPPSGGPWRNTAGRLGWHIDTRAEGGYVVAAGSVVDGCRYRVLRAVPPRVLPDWLARLLAPTPSPAAPAPLPLPARAGRNYVARALEGEVERVLEAPVGQRNAALNRAAWNLARHIATGLLARQHVEDALWEAGVAAGGQTPAGVAATIRSAINARLHRGVGL